MANLAGGQILWNLDIDDSKYKSKVVSAGVDAKTLGSVLDSTDRTFRNFASNAGGAFGQVADGLSSILSKVALVGIAGSIGFAAMTGAAFDQVRQVENATFALKAYEKNADAVKGVLGELIKFARSDVGTLFNREDLFQAASTLKAYGEETSKLTDRVKILARGVSLGQTTFAELSQVIGRAAASGVLAADQYDVLANRGIILDKSLRGAQVSSDGLYKALSDALPAELLEGRGKTIDGLMIRLQSSFRDLGSAILGVDSNTSTFVEGGLGDTFLKLLTQLRDVLASDSIKNTFRNLGKQLSSFATGALPVLLSGLKLLLTNLDTIVFSIVSLTTALIAARTAQFAFNLVAETNPYILAASAIVALVAGLTYLQLRFGFLNPVIKFFQDQINNLKPVIDVVVKAFQDLGRELGEELLGLWRDNKQEIILIGKIFGGALLGAILLVAGAILVTGKALLTFIQIARRVSDAIHAIQDSATEAGKKTTKAFIDAGNAIEDFYNKKIKPTVDKILEIPRAVQSAFDSMRNALRPWQQDFLGTLQNTLNTAKDALIKYDIDTLNNWKQGLTNIVAAISAWALNLYTTISTGLTNAANAVLTWATGLPGQLAAGFAAAYTAVTTWITDTWNAIVGGVTNFGTSIATWLSGLPQKFVDGFNAVKDSITSFFTDLPGNIQDAVNNAGDKTADNLHNGLRSGILNNSRINRIGDAIVLGLALVIGSILIYLVDAGVRIANYIYSGISSLLDRMGGLGRAIVGGVISGMLGALGGAIAAAVQIASTIYNVFKAVFRIASPSKTMATLGEQIMAGMARGIASGTSMAVSAADAASSSVLDSFALGSGMSGAVVAPSVVNSTTVPRSTAQGGTVIHVTQNNSGIVAQSREAWRQINKDGIEAINEELRSKGQPEIGNGLVTPGSSTAVGVV